MSSSLDRQALLQAILALPPYNTWESTGRGRLGLGEWRERKTQSNNNPGLKLDALGLWDFRENRATCSLWKLGSDLGIPGASPRQSHGDTRKSEAEGKERQAAQHKIVERLSAHKQWKKDAKVLLAYFQDQRKIPFPSEKIALKFLHGSLKATVSRYTPKNSTEPRTEIVVPLLGMGGEVVQLLRIEVDEATGEKKAKKLRFRAEAPRAIMWGPKNAHEVVVFEGLEDALTFWFGLDAAGEQDSVRMCVTCGAGGFERIGSLVEGYPSKVVVCDRDLDLVGLRKTECLGPGWLRVIPPVDSPVDINAAWMAGGKEGLQAWFSSLERVTWEALQHEIAERDERDIELARRETFQYHRVKNPWTDAGAARVFIEVWGSEVRVTDDGRFWVWDGRRWTAEHGRGSVLVKIAALAPHYERIAKQYEKDPRCVWRVGKDGEKVPPIEAEKCRDFAEKLGGSSRTVKILAFLGGARALQCSVDDFDSCAWQINLQNGVFDLVKGVLLPHRPEYMCSRISNASWNPEATCPTFEKFLGEIMCGAHALFSFKLRQLGYLLSGYTSEKMFFFHLGEQGNNGKSVEAEVLRYLMGSYARTVPTDLLVEQKYTDTTLYHLATLPGVRLAIASETDEKRAWSEASLKKFTGGSDELPARVIAQQPFNFTPRFKVVVHGNNKPRVTSGDPALWARVCLVPYDFVPQELDLNLVEKLKLEIDGIFVLLARFGFQEWLKCGGLRPPEEVLLAREEYHSETFEQLDQFLEEWCECGEYFEESSTLLWRGYQDFCSSKRKRQQLGSQTAFGREMGRRGYTVTTGGERRKIKYRQGVRLLDVDSRRGSGHGSNSAGRDPGDPEMSDPDEEETEFKH